jgi:RNA polymerase sigma-70 factor (ECF subfamily)
MEDRELVRKILEKDPSAEELLVRLHRETLRRVCVHILGYGDPDIEDILQDTFTAAFQNLGTFGFRSSLAHWLRQICVHLCYRRWRKRKRMVVLEMEKIEQLLTPEALSRPGDEGQEVERARKTEALEKGKQGLGKPCRDLISLRDEKGKSYADISEALRVPMGTVMSRLARCREMLRELVQRVISGEMNG